MLLNQKSVIYNASNGWDRAFRKKIKTVRYGNGDPLKRYAPEEKLRYGSVRYGQGDKFGSTIV